MTITETIAHRIVDEMLAMSQGVEGLGLFASRCEMDAIDPYITPAERRALEARAEKYRTMQLEIMEGKI